MSEEPTIHEAFDEILQRIIDEWYENVSNYYITQEQLEAEDRQGKAELKRFHDEKGHRIKFDKEGLDFTYGLRSRRENDEFVIEISVNNKVPNFDYEGFQQRLTSHYNKEGGKNVPTPYELKNRTYREVFEFRPSLREAFSVETREGKADIMRLAFVVPDKYMQKLAIHPMAGKELVEQYCVSPFRSVYAAVYRGT